MRLASILYESRGDFQTIPGWQNYEINEFGDVRSKVTGRPIAPWKSARKGGDLVLRVSLYNRGRKLNPRVHRLVAMTFLPNPENLPEVDHLDGNTFNNHVTNLEWVTGQENIRRRDQRLAQAA